MERETGLEPATSSLGSWHSTTELLPRSCQISHLTEPNGLAGPSGSCCQKPFQPTLYHTAGPSGRRPKRPSGLGDCRHTLGRGMIQAPGPGARNEPSCVIPCYHTWMGNISVEFSLEQLQAI